MRRAGWMGVVAAALVATGCGGGKGATVATTATVPTTVVATTTTAAAAVVGSDDNAVRLRLSNAATAEFTLFTDAQAFTADPARLNSADPTLTFGAGLAPPAQPQVVNVVVAPDGHWACLTAKADTGHVFVIVVGPNVDAYQATAPLTACNAGAASRLPRVNG